MLPMIRVMMSPAGEAPQRGVKIQTDALTFDAPYPNPLTVGEGTHINFTLPKSADATLTIYDELGRTIRTLASGRFDEGSHTLYWNGRDVTGQDAVAGLYLCKLSLDDGMAMTRMVMLQ